MDGAPGAESLFISQLTRNCGNVTGDFTFDLSWRAG